MANKKETLEIVRRAMNENFRRIHPNGLYFANEPIYGFRVEKERNGYIHCYVRTYRIVRELSRLRPNSLLDVGGGEGYTAHVCKELLDINNVCITEISDEACKRAKEIYSLKAIQGDAAHLPFKDNSFDVVMASETLEHIPYWEKVVKEMLRVAKKGLIITVPHESPELVARSIEQNVPGDHVNSFTRESFDYLEKLGLQIGKGIMLSAPASNFYGILDASPRVYNQFYERKNIPKFLIAAYNQLTPLFAKLFSANTISKAVEFDESLCNKLGAYEGMIFTIVKQSHKLHSKKKISPKQIMDCTVPFHYL